MSGLLKTDLFPRPTVDARKELFNVAKRKAEEIRVQIRKQHQTSLKRGKYEKHSVEQEEVSVMERRSIKPNLTLCYSSKSSRTSILLRLMLFLHLFRKPRVPRNRLTIQFEALFYCCLNSICFPMCPASNLSRVRSNDFLQVSKFCRQDI